MKKLSFLALAAVGLLLGACSSDKDVADQQTPSWDGQGEGYISLSINLPTTPGSTRASNDKYDDGLAAEYKVKDAALLLFAGADEAAATCISAQQLTLPFSVEDDDTPETPADNLTYSYQTVATVSGNMAATDKLYALVCLNYKNILNINTGTASINGQAVNGKTLEETMDAAYEVAGNEEFYIKNGASSKDYFFMTNAALQYADATAKAAAPTGDQIKTLAELDKTKIKKTREEALADPAGDVYVERAVAKATLDWNPAATIPGTVGGTSTPLAIGSVEWVIDNKEPSSYVVRNVGGVDDYIAYSSEGFATPYYRMVGDVKMGKTAILHNYDADIYRTYWCYDPQYDVTAVGLLRSDNTAGVTNWGATGVNNPQYCNENTFNVANQLYKNTTRAILKVTPATLADFYTVNGNQERYSQTDAESYLAKGIVDHAKVIAAFKDVTKAGKSFEILPEYFTITYADDAATGKHTVATVAIKTTALSAFVGTDDTKPLSANPTIAAADLTSIISDVNDDVKVLKYTDGIVYYEARFEHFALTAYEKSLSATNLYSEANAKAQGDLAPWNCWEVAPNKPSAATAYPDGPTKSAEENYLGRWGMVRNNWYDVTVNAFNKIGSPVDPSGNVENPDTPDDNVEEYISVKIHILSWAKRTQGWSF